MNKTYFICEVNGPSSKRSGAFGKTSGAQAPKAPPPSPHRNADAVNYTGNALIWYISIILEVIINNRA